MSEIFRRAFDLLRRNPIVLAPSVVVAVLSAAAAYVLRTSGDASWDFFGDLNAQGPQGFWLFFQTVIALSLRILGTLIVIAFTTGMAGAAWTRGSATLADGARAFARRGLQAAWALAMLFIIGVAASVLVVPTFGISVLLYATFVLYTMPAAIVGGRPAVDGIVESFRVAARNFGVTFAVVLLVIVLAVLGGLAGELSGRIPVLGDAVAWVVMQIVVAYATMVIVGEYLKLAAPADQAPQQQFPKDPALQ